MTVVSIPQFLVALIVGFFTKRYKKVSDNGTAEA
jgi:hypothetical protein